MKICFTCRREYRFRGPGVSQIGQKSMPERSRNKIALTNAPRTAERGPRQAQEKPRTACTCVFTDIYIDVYMYINKLINLIPPTPRIKIIIKFIKFIKFTP